MLFLMRIHNMLLFHAFESICLDSIIPHIFHELNPSEATHTQSSHHIQIIDVDVEELCNIRKELVLPLYVIQ